MDEATFLGETISFWLELRNSKSMKELDLIKESIKLRAKVSYYESQFDKISEFRTMADRELP